MLLLILFFSILPKLPAQSDLDLPEAATLVVEVDPEEARIYIDNEPVGTGRIERSDLRPGSYKIEARLAGYYSEVRYVTLRAGSRTELSIDLDQVVGFLDVRTTPPGAQVIVGESTLSEFPAELPTGVYRIRIRSFGFRDVVRRVVIEERRTTRVEVDLEPAPFEITSFSVGRSRFNPQNPGSVGTTTVAFEVTAPGSGDIEVRGPEGELLLREPLEEFRSWEQEFIWDGRDSFGAPLPRGTYTIALFASGPSGEGDREVRASRAAEVLIDPAVISRFRSLFSGSSGLLYLPMAEPVGPGTAQVATEGFLYNSSGDKWYAPFVFAARFALGPPVELSLSLAPLLSSRSEESRAGVTAAVSWRYAALPGRFASGLALRGSLDTPVGGSFGGRDERTAPSGIALQHPVTLYLGSFFLGVTPEVHLGIDPVSYDFEPAGGDPALWGYLRAGVGYDGEYLSLGISGALRSEPFSEELDRLEPVALGAEARLRVPQTPLYLSLLAAGDLYPEEQRFLLKSGFGVGLLF